MGTRYSAVSISGYNSSPPADDGTVAASNQVKWSNHLTKIGNPIKTAVETIDSQLQAALSMVSRSITSSESVAASDHLKTIVIAASVVTSTVTVTLPDASTIANGYVVRVSNQSAVNQTVTRATASNTIDTVTASVSILPYQAITFIVNSTATGYVTQRSYVSSPTQTFVVDSALTSDNNVGTGYVDVVNTGSIGAAGQTWLINATATMLDASVPDTFNVRLWDGSTVYKETSFSNSAGFYSPSSLSIVVTLSAAATFYLSCKGGNAAATVKATASGGATNKATWINAVRLA